MIDANAVASAHDAMALEYDEIDDLWYPHLFNAIHGMILDALPSNVEMPARALDVGCGTGLQSWLLARAGYEVTGFDISQKLIEEAMRKGKGEMLPPLGFRTSRREFSQEQEALTATADAHRKGVAWVRPTFKVGDATDPTLFPADWYDVIVCCGSVLSFVDAHDDVVSQMARSLRKGGRLVIEVEQRLNVDLVWPFVDWMTFGKLHYEQSLGESIRNLLTAPGKNLRVDYPFDLITGKTVWLPIWLFSVSHLERLFKRSELRVIQRRGVHAVTNLIPSTVLHQARPGPRVKSAFTTLRRWEHQVWEKWPFWRLGCSVIYVVEK